MCCVTFYPVWKGPDNIQEQLCRQGEGGKEKEGANVTISLLWLISNAPSLSPSCCLLESLCVYSMVGCTGLPHDENCSKMVAMEAHPRRTFLSPEPLSNIASCWVALSEHLRTFWCRLYNFGVISIFSSVFGQFLELFSAHLTITTAVALTTDAENIFRTDGFFKPTRNPCWG